MTTSQGSFHTGGPVPEKDFPWVIIGVSTVVVLFALVAGLYLVFSSLSARPVGAPPVGEPPAVATPAACEQPCFTIEDARSLAPSPASLATIGSPPRLHEPRPGEVISEYYNEATMAFYEAQGRPVGCAFDLSSAPIVPSSISYNGFDDLAVDYGSWGDESRSLTQIARVFEAELYASRYQGAISGLVRRCPTYELTAPEGGVTSYSVAPITIDVAQPSVEVVAWRATSTMSTRTVADFRYGLIAMRTTFSGDSWTDEDIAGYLTDTAERLVAQGE